MERERSHYIHRWETLGVGTAPYRALGVISLPSPSLAETNTTAYNLQLQEASEAAQNLGVSLGSCRVCGMGIMNNYVIKDATGRHFVVGSDCVRKAGDSKLVSEVEKLERLQSGRIRRLKAEEKAEKRRLEVEAELERQRAETGGRTYQEIEAAKRAEVLAVRAAFIAEKNDWLIRVLERAHQGGFVQSILDELRGTTLASVLPPRALAILSDIYAKTAGGRSGSKGYDVALNEFTERLEAMREYL